MLNTIIPIILPVHSGHSRPMTEADAHALVGVFVVCSIIYLCTLSYATWLWWRQDKDYRGSLFDALFSFDIPIYVSVTNVLMTIIYGVVLLAFLGICVSKLIF